MVAFHKIFFKIKILFSIRIRIIISLWISIPELHFIHRRHPPNFVWIHQFLLTLLFPRPRFHVRTYRQTDRQSDRRTDGIFLLVLCSKKYKTWIFIKRREFFLTIPTYTGDHKCLQTHLEILSPIYIQATSLWLM